MAVPSKYIQSVVKAAKGRPKSTDWYREKIREFGTPKALDLRGNAENLSSEQSVYLANARHYVFIRLDSVRPF